MKTPLEKILDVTKDVTSPTLRFGIRANGVPHIGTWMTLAYCFAIGRHLNGKILIDVLDNATLDGPQDQFRHSTWQTIDTSKLWAENYEPYLTHLQTLTAVSFQTQTYTQIQSERTFRKQFLASLIYLDELKKLSPLQGLLPSKTIIGIRIHCPNCGLMDKDGASVKHQGQGIFDCLCPVHGKYRVQITETDSTYLNLTPLYRNILKETLCCKDAENTVVLKASDWLLAVLLIDAGLDILGENQKRPVRIFVPQIFTDQGLKLSKSAIQKNGTPFSGIDTSLLQAPIFAQRFSDYAERFLNAAETTLMTADHSFKAYTCGEILKFLES